MSPLEYLGSLYPDPQPGEHLTLRWTPPYGKAPTSERHFDLSAPDALESAVALAHELTAQACSVFHTRGTTDGLGKSAANALTTTYLTADVDLALKGEARDYPTDTVGLAKALKAVNLPEPTYLIRTSPGGYLAVWLLTRAVPSNQGHNKRLLDAIRQQYGGYKLDETGDPARAVRLSGTRNCKPEYGPDFPIVELEQTTDTRLDPDLIPLPAKPERPAPKKKTTTERT